MYLTSGIQLDCLSLESNYQYLDPHLSYSIGHLSKYKQPCSITFNDWTEYIIAGWMLAGDDFSAVDEQRSGQLDYRSKTKMGMQLSDNYR